MEQELIQLLDDYLDDSEDEDLEEMFVTVLKNRSVYSFLEVLHKISYPRIKEIWMVATRIVYRDMTLSEYMKRHPETYE